MTNQLKPLQLGASSSLTYFAMEKQHKKETAKLCLGGAPIQMDGYIALAKKKKCHKHPRTQVCLQTHRLANSGLAVQVKLARLPERSKDGRYLQSDVEHHRGDEVDVGESDSQSPCEIKKYQQSPCQAFAKHPVSPTRRAGEAEHQV